MSAERHIDAAADPHRAAMGVTERRRGDARYALTIAALLVLLLAGIAASLLVGVVDLARLDGAILSLRATRCTAAALAGAALAVAGVLVQGLFRNPLAAPSVIGTTAGAAFGGQVVMVGYAAISVALPAWLVPELVLPFGCLAGAAASLIILIAICRRQSSLITVLLVGFILASLFGSLSALVVSMAQAEWELGRAVIAFSLGNLEGKGPRHLALAAPLVVTGVIAAWCWGRPLDLLLSGEEEARSLGVDTGAVRRWALCWTAVLTSAAVAVGGGVGFVGLVVPHALRPLIGAAHRRLMPAAALGGAVFLIFCDVAARQLPAVGAVPLGVVTGVIGAPIFLILFLRLRRESAW